jgi:protein-L-isoaspartate(D-aspartate) O-methyltransferase
MDTVRKNLPVDNQSARINMIESQLRPNMVRDERVLTAMESLPREIFVPSSMAGIAYMDEDIQVVQGRYILEPMIQARLVQAAMIKPADRILDIAAATGYSSAIVASMATEVFSVESDNTLHAQAASNLASLGIKNVKMILGAMNLGWEASSPYDVIIINGCVELIPDAIFAQLNEAGRLVAVMNKQDAANFAHTGQAYLFEKLRGQISSRPLFGANVKPVPGFEQAKGFVF